MVCRAACSFTDGRPAAVSAACHLCSELGGHRHRQIRPLHVAMLALGHLCDQGASSDVTQVTPARRANRLRE